MDLLVRSPFCRKEHRKVDFVTPIRSSRKISNAGTLSGSKGFSPSPTDDEKRSLESYKASSSQALENKLTTLMAYRKAKGLCFKCGLRWNPSHKCAPTFALNVVEELWQLIQDPNVELSVSSPHSSGSDFGEDYV